MKLLKCMLLAILAAALAGCGAAGASGKNSEAFSNPAPTQPSAVAAGAAADLSLARLPVFPSDSLDPFNCTTMQNFYLSGLLYDPLVALDAAYSPENRLAQEVTLNGAACVVKLRPEAVFSDGSAVTAADVLYSLELARASERYAVMLSGVTGAEAPDTRTVAITLAAPDVLFERSLCFPVVKRTAEAPEETAGQEDAPTQPRTLPVGAGRYVREDDRTLRQNPLYWGGNGGVETIRLVEISGIEDQSYQVMQGSIDLMYSDLRAELNLGLGTGYRQVVLNNLVFVGANSAHPALGTQVRRVISGAISRGDIARKVYLGFAVPTLSPLNPAFGEIPAESAETEQSPERANEELDELGFSARDELGYRMSQGARFTLGILVNKENADRRAAAELIAASLRQLGISAAVEAEAFADYTKRVSEGNYDLYIGEVKLSYNMDISGLLSPNEIFGPGIAQDDALVDGFRRARAGETTFEQLDAMLREALPVIPVVFRRGIICFSRAFSANIVATEQDIFYNIRDW